MPFTNRWEWPTLAVTALSSIVARLNEALSKLALSYNTHKHGVLDIDATGTPDGTTVLIGDGTWGVPPGGGLVPASDVTSGTFNGGNYSFPAALSVVGALYGASLSSAVAVTAPAGAAANLDFYALGNYQVVVLDSPTCALTFTNPPGVVGMALDVAIVQDAVGGRLVTWPGSVLWVTGTTAVLKTAPDAFDVVRLLWTGAAFLAQLVEAPGGGAVPASSVTAGTFGAGSYVFPAGLTVTTSLVVSNNLAVAWYSEFQTGAAVSPAGLATTATDGYFWLPSCAGVPTGVPTAHGNAIALVVDRTNDDIYAYLSGAWMQVNGGGGALALYPNSRVAAVDTTVAAGMSVDVVGDYSIANGFVLTLTADAVMAIH